MNAITIPKETWDGEYKSILTNITDEELKYIKEIISKEDRSQDEIQKCNCILKKPIMNF